MIVMVHQNPARVDRGELYVDRKFHLGMLAYAKALRAPIVTVQPQLQPGAPVMDAIQVPVADLPYGIRTIATGRNGRLTDPGREELRGQIGGARLVYGQAMEAAAIAREHGVPYVMMVEYDLDTQLRHVWSQDASLARRMFGIARCSLDFAFRQRRDFKLAESIHCNGYPIYDETAAYNDDRLLYFDSRLTSFQLISEDALSQRLATFRTGRPLRFLFSGRYERIKGAADAVAVAVECQKRGLDIEMEAYGEGSQRPEMERRAAQAPKPGAIRINAQIPFHELLERAKTFDIFVCCHIQGDPSCSYLEAFGAGLPIAGYTNRMWRRLCESSNGGLSSQMGRPDLVAAGIERMAREKGLLETVSTNAREFVAAHTFEAEFGKRTDALNEVYERSSKTAAGLPKTSMDQARPAKAS